MPSTTRGSILISTANDIGEALVEKLGGVGYSPNDWKNNINLCGIAPIDSAPALSVLADSAGTGDERGSILIATADAIGAILNKKYNVLRGFKPKEWASAISKLAPLPERTASGSIAHITDGADRVPIKSWEVEITPTLTGKPAIECTQTWKNLCPNSFEQGSFSESAPAGSNYATMKYGNTIRGRSTDIFRIDNGNVNISCADGYQLFIILFGSDRKYLGKYVGWTTDTAITNSSAYYIAVAFKRNDNGTITGADFEAVHVMCEVGSSASAYSPYIAPTISTVNLGRTIYGGTADVVKGTGTDGHIKRKYTSTSGFSILNANDYTQFYITVSDMKNSADAICSVLPSITLAERSTKSGLVQYASDNALRFSFLKSTGILTMEDFANYLSNNDVQVVFEKLSPTDFTFTPITPTPETALGVNNFWADEGDSEVTYRAEQEPYTRKTATGGIANFSDQRTDLPLTKAIANIAPSIAGKSAVNLIRAGKNLFDKGNPNVVDGYITTTGFSTSNTSAKTVYIPIVGGATYTVSKTAGQRFQIATAEVEPTNNAVFTSRQAGNTSTSLTITASANDKYLWAWIFLDGTDSGTLAEMLNSIQIEVGSTASTFEPYQDPTTYTAELGETVYGGSVDFVSGEVKQVVKKKTVSSFSGTYGAVNNGYAYYITDAGTTHNVSAVNPAMMIANQLFTYGSSSRGNAPAWQYGGNDGGDQTHTFILPSEYDTLTKANNFLANLETPLEVTLTLATPTESTIPGRVISPIEGVNNYWNDAGGDTEIEYFEDEA